MVDHPREALFTTEEYDELFGDHNATPEREGPRGLWVIAAFVVAGMLASAVAWAAVHVLQNSGKTDDLATLRSWVAASVASSEYEFLIDEVRFESIADIDIGGYVSTPADGIIHIDDRAWSREGLIEVLHHEIGHLLDVATRDVLAEARGGLDSEVWAECSAVDTGGRRIDENGSTERYRCGPDELERYRQTIDGVAQICRTYPPLTCRSGS